MLPTVTIITICYNAEEFIERTMKSVEAQTYPNIEYLIIDGVSKDNTLEIVQQYRHIVSKVVSEPDKSLYDAMNKGIRHATGDYIWFMNAGDRIATPQVLENAIKGSNNADFIYGKTLRVTEDGKEHPWHKAHPSANDLTWKSFRNGLIVCHQSMIVRRSIAPEYDLSWKHVADLDWILRVMKQVNTVHDTEEYMSLFLEGGYSNKTKRASLMERFKVLTTHFGIGETIIEHVSIVFRRLVGR